MPLLFTAWTACGKESRGFTGNPRPGLEAVGLHTGELYFTPLDTEDSGVDNGVTGLVCVVNSVPVLRQRRSWSTHRLTDFGSRQARALIASLSRKFGTRNKTNMFCKSMLNKYLSRSFIGT